MSLQFMKNFNQNKAVFLFLSTMFVGQTVAQKSNEKWYRNLSKSALDSFDKESNNQGLFQS